MSKKTMDRREFIKTGVASAAALGGLSLKGMFSDTEGTGIEYDSKGIPCRQLGKTGVSIPIIVFGGGSRFCTIKDPDESARILTYALDHGFYYWDTAHDYVFDGVVSEERYGLVLKDRREEVFLSTKVGDRTYDGAMRHVEESLERLKTSHVELLQIHDVRSLEDVDVICAKNSVYKALLKLKDEKVTRYIGFTGHTAAELMKTLAERLNFDTMLIALNHYTQGKEDFEKHAIPFAAGKGMGIMVIKVIRPRETVEGIDPADLIHYALTLPHVNAAVIGIDSMEVLKKDLALAKAFQPLSDEKMRSTRAALEPFFQSHALPWMQPGYRDGNP